jgi:hypothetical protein
MTSLTGSGTVTLAMPQPVAIGFYCPACGACGSSETHRVDCPRRPRGYCGCWQVTGRQPANGVHCYICDRPADPAQVAA